MLHRFAATGRSLHAGSMGAAPLALATAADPGGAARRRRGRGRPGTAAGHRCRRLRVPGIAKTPDGWTLTVAAKDETQLPMAPLTTAVSSREWLVADVHDGHRRRQWPR